MKLHTVYAVISEVIKPLQLELVGQAAFKFESKFEPLPVIWRSLRRLFQKRIEGSEGEITGQALGAALLLCLRVGRASTNTGYFRVDGSHGRCGPRQARLTKTYYHSCNTDSGQESTRFQCFVDIGGGRVTFFSHVR